MDSKRVSFTTSWPQPLKDFIQGPLQALTLIKPAQVTQAAMEQWLKDNGHWAAYEEYKLQQIL